jgi:hypothetical protein
VRSGTLVLEIHRAANLLAMDANGLSDPYCRVFYTDQKLGRTVTVFKTLNPVFNCKRVMMMMVMMMMGEHMLVLYHPSMPDRQGLMDCIQHSHFTAGSADK